MHDRDLGNSNRRAIGRYLRWTARTLGTLIALFALFMLLSHLFFDEEVEPVEDTSAWVGVGVGLVASWVALSLLAGWRWEREAGISTIAAGIGIGLFVFFTAGSNELIVALAMGVPIALIGGMYLYAAAADRRGPRLG